MKTRKIFISIGGLLLLGIAGVLFFAFVVSPSREQWQQSHAISVALRDARSVTITEFTPHYVDEDSGTTIPRVIIFQKLTATSDQVEAFRSATQTFLTFQTEYSIHGCFTPHHRVEIVRRDGTFFRLDLCFQCKNFRFDHQYIQPIPSSWLPPLRRYFSGLGMPPRTDEEYQELTRNKTKAS